MCLILVAYKCDPKHPLIIAANRDEFYARPTLTAHSWKEATNIFGGRDIQANGTWLGVSMDGRFAAVTNWTANPPEPQYPNSRGELVSQFLRSSLSSNQYITTIMRSNYAGFNFLAYDGENLAYTTNRIDEIRTLKPGYYGLTNTHLDNSWPKSVQGKNNLESLVLSGKTGVNELINILSNTRIPADTELPKTQLDLDTARRTAACFIKGDVYGTRASTALIMSAREIKFLEQAYGPHGVKEKVVSREFLLEI